ncbi:1-phosphatidylinositol 4,5-bisphosphate phosphodiesterase delta-4 [Geranomyces variabilis]|uniref:Phosphoinositide phospholipase C n=1 Tax=Geranomyces variabilis TaxID=109894 RepID=A0AAD5TRI5_9FUNG|nr:1-phosphatidylinositol 4,5-bisphosphate phosphodiesterase delta-4 [Geranomyces variabilis]
MSGDAAAQSLTNDLAQRESRSPPLLPARLNNGASLASGTSQGGLSSIDTSSEVQPPETLAVPTTASADSNLTLPAPMLGSNNITSPLSAGPISPYPVAGSSPASSGGIPPPPPINPKDLEEMLTTGTRMIKYPSKSKSKPAERLIRVDLSSLQIFWESKKKKADLRYVDLHTIKEIRLGQNTKGFELHGRKPEQNDRSFSVIYVQAGEYKMLNLVALTREDAARWVSGLHMLMGQADISGGDPARLSHNMSTWLRKQWNEADTSRDGRLDLDEVTDLMKKLNIRLSKSEVKSTFKSADIDKFGHLTFPAFERLYRLLRFRPEIGELFSSLSVTRSAPVITYDEFARFVLVTQKNDWTEDRCLEIYQKYAAPDGGSMSVDHFSAFLLSANNTIFKKAHTLVFQDMTRPLTDYFINTSHNTYLLKDQLKGESSVEGYIRALQRGCRCVELDCYDGANGSPVIYHGRTLVGKLPFRDVVEAIGKYAFVASPYPVTMSLESHCGPEQQVVMATILREVLGDALLRKPLSDKETRLPSPEQLMGKIIIKGKILPAGEDEACESDEETDMGGNPVPNLANVVDVPLHSVAASVSDSPVAGELTSPTSQQQQQQARRRKSDEDAALTLTLSRKRSSPKMSRKCAVAKPLAELLVYCKGVHFRSFAAANEGFSFDYMCSLSEKKSLELLAKQRSEYTAHTSRWLTRIYPAGLRITSSNYDPVPHWAGGAQMVAMNMQTFDRGMQLNNALFNLNGRCGYVLKPRSLREKGVAKQGSMVLKIKIISGQQLPKPKDDVSSSSVIDPYVELEVAGSVTDNVKYRTRAISNNGFNPMWNEEFRFLVTDPDLALLRFSIYDMDVKLTNDLVGSYAIPVQSLEQGYRHVPVYNWKGDLIRFSSLFIRVVIDRPNSPHPTHIAGGGPGVSGSTVPLVNGGESVAGSSGSSVSVTQPMAPLLSRTDSIEQSTSPASASPPTVPMRVESKFPPSDAS